MRFKLLVCSYFAYLESYNIQQLCVLLLIFLWFPGEGMELYSREAERAFTRVLGVSVLGAIPLSCLPLYYFTSITLPQSEVAR